MDAFDAFESKEADPAAEFLAREQAELAKIENNELGNDFDGFGSTQESDPFNSEPVQQSVEPEEPKVSLSLFLTRPF